MAIIYSPILGWDSITFLSVLFLGILRSTMSEFFDLRVLVQLVRDAFAQRRKMLINNLKKSKLLEGVPESLLKWDDVDFDAGRVRLWTRKRHGGGLEFDWLPMTKMLSESLIRWQENRPIKDAENVFLCLEKKNFCIENYGKPFKHRQHFMGNLCERAEVKPFGFHAIRHLTASTLYKLGYTVADIQIVLRHESATTTAKYIKSLGSEGVRPALEALSQQKGKVLPFRQRDIAGIEKEKAVSGAVNS
jgi:hypothetical protein